MTLANKLRNLVQSKQAKPKKRVFSRPRDLKVLISTRDVVAKTFLAVSPVFMRKYRGEFSVASRLIFENIRRLKKGQVIEKNGFVIKSQHTGKFEGSHNTLTLSVSFKGKTYFVKFGSHSGEKQALAYQKVKALFESKHNSMEGYNVEVVPYHFIYSKSNMKRYRVREILVSDFFPSNKVTLVDDIEQRLGTEQFNKTKLGTAIKNIGHFLNDNKIFDMGPHNCFFNKSSKTIYFFDLNTFAD